MISASAPSSAAVWLAAKVSRGSVGEAMLGLIHRHR
jgi:hypothetical protein